MIEKKRSHGRLRLLMAANTFRTVLMYLPKCVRVFLVYLLHANEIINLSTDIKIALFSIYIVTEITLWKENFLYVRC